MSSSSGNSVPMVQPAGSPSTNSPSNVQQVQPDVQALRQRVEELERFRTRTDPLASPRQPRPRCQFRYFFEYILLLAFVLAFTIAYVKSDSYDQTATVFTNHNDSDIGTVEVCPCSSPIIPLSAFATVEFRTFRDANNVSRYEYCRDRGHYGHQFCEATLKAIREDVLRNTIITPIKLSNESLRATISERITTTASNFFNLFIHIGELAMLQLMHANAEGQVIFSDYPAFEISEGARVYTSTSLIYSQMWPDLLQPLNGLNIAYELYAETCKSVYCTETRKKSPIAITFEVVGWSTAIAGLLIITLVIIFRLAYVTETCREAACPTRTPNSLIIRQIQNDNFHDAVVDID